MLSVPSTTFFFFCQVEYFRLRQCHRHPFIYMTYFKLWLQEMGEISGNRFWIRHLYKYTLIRNFPYTKMNFSQRANVVETVWSNFRASDYKRISGLYRSAMNLSSLLQGDNNASFTTPNAPVDPVEFNSTAVLMSFLIFLALFGNGLVILAFYRFHQLRTITNYFVISLAVADILVASLAMPCWMYIGLTDLSMIPRDKQLNTVLYYSWQYMDILCSTASIVNLCVISVDRHLAIHSPLTYHSRMTPKRAKVSIAFAWLFAFFCASLSVASVILKPLWPISGRAYAIFISFVAFFLPLLILIGVYSKIGCIALRQVREICAVNTEIQHGIQREHSMTFRRELRVTKMLGIVVGAFVLCWGPFFAVVLLYAVCPACPNFYGLVPTSKWLHYANSTLNPIIYMFFTRTFRSAFRRLLVRGLCCMTLPHGGRLFNLNIWKNGSVEPCESFSVRKTYHEETTEIHRRKTRDNLGEMTASIEHTKIYQLSVTTSTWRWATSLINPP